MAAFHDVFVNTVASRAHVVQLLAACHRVGDSAKALKSRLSSGKSYPHTPFTAVQWGVNMTHSCASRAFASVVC